MRLVGGQLKIAQENGFSSSPGLIDYVLVLKYGCSACDIEMASIIVGKEVGGKVPSFMGLAFSTNETSHHCLTRKLRDAKSEQWRGAVWNGDPGSYPKLLPSALWAQPINLRFTSLQQMSSKAPDGPPW